MAGPKVSIIEVPLYNIIDSNIFIAGELQGA